MSRADRILVAAVGGALVLALAAGFVMLAPADGPPSGLDGPDALLVASSVAGSPDGNATGEPIVVDVSGAVARPGIVELPGGSRIADAIDAAGGFATDADLSAASQINLALALVDGQQVRVPRLGESTASGPNASAAPGGGGSEGGTGGRLVNVNTATPEELEALPGIGAVTVQKIVAARQERPFGSLQEMVDRGVIHRGQLEDIMDLATAG